MASPSTATETWRPSSRDPTAPSARDPDGSDDLHRPRGGRDRLVEGEGDGVGHLGDDRVAGRVGRLEHGVGRGGTSRPQRRGPAPAPPARPAPGRAQERRRGTGAGTGAMGPTYVSGRPGSGRAPVSRSRVLACGRWSWLAGCLVAAGRPPAPASCRGWDGLGGVGVASSAVSSDVLVVDPDEDAPDLPVDPSYLEDLRRARRRRRVSGIHWVDALYHAYLAALFGTIAVAVATGAIGDTALSPAQLDDVTTRGPAVIGLFAALAVGVGLRSGSRGGPLAVEPGDVRYVLLAPLDRGLALRGPALRQLRTGRVRRGAGRRGHRAHGRPPLPRARAGVDRLRCAHRRGGGRAQPRCAALIASGRRLSRPVATALAGVLVAWSAVDVAGVEVGDALLPASPGAGRGLAGAGPPRPARGRGRGAGGRGLVVVVAGRRRGGRDLDRGGRAPHRPRRSAAVRGDPPGRPHRPRPAPPAGGRPAPGPTVGAHAAATEPVPGLATVLERPAPLPGLPPHPHGC